MLMCINELAGGKLGTVFYIGDHETDAVCVSNTNRTLIKGKREICVRSIGAFYGSNNSCPEWNFQPDFKVNKVGEILEIVENYR